MACRNCGGDRILSLSAKCDDRCSINYRSFEKHDYVPDGLGIGGGDYIEFDYCLDCGIIQSDKFPVQLEEAETEE